MPSESALPATDHGVARGASSAAGFLQPRLPTKSARLATYHSVARGSSVVVQYTVATSAPVMLSTTRAASPFCKTICLSHLPFSHAE